MHATSLARKIYVDDLLAMASMVLRQVKYDSYV